VLYWINPGQLGLTCKIHNLSYEIMITHIKQIKTNHEAQFLINLILNDEIEKTNQLKNQLELTQVNLLIS
jgi:hypothetical protein